MGDFMNEEIAVKAIVIAVGVVLIFWAIVIIINLIINYKKESKKADEILKEKQKNNELQNKALQINSLNGDSFNNLFGQQGMVQNNMVQNNVQKSSSMQVAYAQAGNVPFTQYEPDKMDTFKEEVGQMNNGFYAAVTHFTDTGRSGLRGDYTNGTGTLPSSMRACGTWWDYC